MCLVSVEVRRKHCILSDRKYRWLQVTMWVLESKSRSSVKIESVILTTEPCLQSLHLISFSHWIWNYAGIEKTSANLLYLHFKMFGLQAYMWPVTHMFAWIFTLVMSSEVAFSYFYKLPCSIANTLTPKFILLQQKMEHFWVYMVIQYFRQMIITS